VIDQGDMQQGSVIKHAMVVTVTVSLVVHSLTVPLGIRWCGKDDTGQQPVHEAGSRPPRA
jgi:NhaP-type Na+/H+ or K+/H+ antiporter